MGNRHGSMGVTINYDADLQASVETASVISFKAKSKRMRALKRL